MALASLRIMPRRPRRGPPPTPLRYCGIDGSWRVANLWLNAENIGEQIITPAASNPRQA